MTDDELLTSVQQATLRYFWEYGHPISGLARERKGSRDTCTSGGTGFGMMAIMVGVVGALSAFYHDSLDISNAQHREIAAYRLISKMPTLAAMSYKYANGQPFVYPDNSLSYAGNFLKMMSLGSPVGGIFSCLEIVL